jgi:hypothetical protein
MRGDRVPGTRLACIPGEIAVAETISGERRSP